MGNEIVDWGKHKGLTYDELASKNRWYCLWAAKNISGMRGALCAEALAKKMGII
jgi:hypothetical protein